MKFVYTRQLVPPTLKARLTSWPYSMIGPSVYGWYIEDEEVTTLEALGSIAKDSNMVTYVVFWLDEGQAMSSKVDNLAAMLKLTEDLRKQQRAGDPVSHIASCVDDLIQVGHPGVDTVNVDYDWKKRRCKCIGPSHWRDCPHWVLPL